MVVDEKVVLQSLKTDFLMASFKRLYYVAEAAEKIMADCIDGEDKTDVVIIPPENVDGMMDDEEIDGDGDKIDNGLPNDLCGIIQL